MEKNQKINCTVNSCKFNDEKKQKCQLEQIVVEPIEQCDTQEPDESMCGSYEYGNNQNNE